MDTEPQSDKHGEGDTPRTDTVWKAIGNLGHDRYDLMHNHARQLERELAEVRARVQIFKDTAETFRIREQIAHEKLSAQRPSLAATVSADSHDELPRMACIVRASGEGVTDWKLCLTDAEVRAAYVEMVCGADDEAHKEEIDGIMATFHEGADWRGDTLKIDLYCASFTITRFPADCIPFAVSPLAATERTHPNGLWMVYYEDASKKPEIFFGEGAEETARLRYKQAYDAWSCHLLSRVPDPKIAPEAEARYAGTPLSARVPQDDDRVSLTPKGAALLDALNAPTDDTAKKG